MPETSVHVRDKKNYHSYRS